MVKEHTMKRLAVILAGGLVLAGCASTSVSRAFNRDNLNKLRVGMTMAEVRQIMGQPYKTESSRTGQVWYYDTGVRRDEEGDHHAKLTPLFFGDGKLVTWKKPEGLGLHLE